MMLKKELELLVEQPSIDFTDELLSKMLAHIGDVDSELRDSLICNLFYEGIPSGGITHAQQKWLLNEILTCNLVMNGIEQSEGDLVFTRTFSLLVLALILKEDSCDQFLTNTQRTAVFSLVHNYLRTEQDTRGYVKDKGWAHGLAHGADLLVSVVAHQTFEVAEVERVLATLTSIILRDTQPFIADEEGRLCKVLLVLIAHYPESSARLLGWLEELGREVALRQEEDTFNAYQVKQKYRQVLKSLYFQLEAAGEQPVLSEQVKQLVLVSDKK